MKRRDFVSSVIVGGLATPVLGDAAGPKDQGQQGDQGEHGNHGNHGDNDKHKNHLVTFGHWNPTLLLPVDRMGADPNPRTQNGHEVIKQVTKVEVGDSVTFAISGFHNLLIYGPGTQPQDIDRTKLLNAAGFPPLINDDRHRLYRGLDPRANPAVQDRLENVGFNQPGRFLVMCGVLPHFFDAPTGQFIMFGYVEVDD